ncbi:uncharacterized protein BO95DRAFT_441911 [Aspergillus brunneoviolaceus CBS 621.78]|uniref:Uncharacterized protein n=1 Tax=Aspergillus brunneoviolaceus CBS 621.78 TaxID=1450534 RepID=A0ACD1GBZ3_9EURO|nr:hypothetical protein BO95DRAFT_441911 [Aspergillus brunneoviolaceus CBS 621.78]RAH46683.1 hypothetical protein BO95DRAFT_441911 [Aspergillus brunneoviolaceus CBS 621.78]
MRKYQIPSIFEKRHTSDFTPRVPHPSDSRETSPADFMLALLLRSGRIDINPQQHDIRAQPNAWSAYPPHFTRSPLHWR